MSSDTDPIFSFFVAGTPHPQGSKTAFVRGGRAVLVDGKGKGIAAHKAWRKAVSDATEAYLDENGLEEFDGIARVELHFFMPKPKTKGKRIQAVSVRPDIDKLARSVLDATTSLNDTKGLYSDDSHVVQLYADKMYALGDQQTGVQIDVFDIEEIRLIPE